MIIPAKTGKFSIQRVASTLVIASLIALGYIYFLYPGRIHADVGSLGTSEDTHQEHHSHDPPQPHSQPSSDQEPSQEFSKQVASEDSFSEAPPSPQPNPHWHGWREIKHLVAFGDSLSSTRFQVHGHQPSKGNPIGNPPYPGITSTIGPNWLGYLTAEYNATFLQTVNLAYSGATVDNDIVPAMSTGVKSFKEQVLTQWMELYVPPQGSFEWSPHDTLFATFIGNNDVRDSFLTDTMGGLGKSVEQYMELLHTIYQSGARNFLVLNILPFNRAPLANREDPTVVQTLGQLIQQYNDDLERGIAKFRENHLDAAVFYFDANRLFNRLLDDPCSHDETCPLEVLDRYCETYRVEKNDSYLFAPECEVAADKYFWLGTVHACFRVHKVLAKSIVEFLDANT